MTRQEIRQVAREEGFGWGTKAMYKGYSLISMSKRMATSVCVILDDQGKLVYMQSGYLDSDRAKDTLVEFVDNLHYDRDGVHREKKDIKIQIE